MHVDCSTATGGDVLYDERLIKPQASVPKPAGERHALVFSSDAALFPQKSRGSSRFFPPWRKRERFNVEPFSAWHMILLVVL